MNQEQIGKFIKKIRTDNNLTQNDFANKLGVTYQAVSKWENGKAIPDIALLKEISKEFNVSIDELLEGKKIKKDKKFNKLPLIIIIIVIIVGVILIVINNNDDYEFKKISTTCSNFKVSGSAAYNKSKTSLYISNIEFCGKEDNTVYKKIECDFYEKYEDKIIKISSCMTKGNISLQDYLKTTQISVNNYNSVCKKVSSSKLYLEINATDKSGDVTTYKVPLKLKDNCIN